MFFRKHRIALLTAKSFTSRLLICGRKADGHINILLGVAIWSIPAGKKVSTFRGCVWPHYPTKDEPSYIVKTVVVVVCFFFFCDSNVKEADIKFKTLYCNKLQCILLYRLYDLFFFRFLSFTFHLSELIPSSDIFNTSKRKDCKGEVLKF